MTDNLLGSALSDTKKILNQTLESYGYQPEIQEVGTITYLGPGIVRVAGLRGVKSDELIIFSGARLGMAFNVDQKETGVVLLDEGDELKAGDEAQRTGRVLDIPVGKMLLGRVVDG